MGQGMALITPEPDKVLRAAKEYGIDAQISGEIVAEPTVRITSRGSENAGQDLVFAVE